MGNKMHDPIRKRELEDTAEHRVPERKVPAPAPPKGFENAAKPYSGLYLHEDLSFVQMIQTSPVYVHILKSLDELLQRDAQRKKDGFPKKIKLGKVIKPSREGKKKVVVVPTVVEEKFIHDTRPYTGESESAGSGEGEEGEVIGEEPIHATEGGSEAGAGQGGEAQHDIESTAYDLGKMLTEQFSLPHLKEKGKRRSMTKFVYDLTDRNRGFGQLLEKKQTLKRVIETNLALGNIKNIHAIEPDSLLVSPRDRVYRTLSRERDFESQAVVFFVRDYSASMRGKPTELVVSQHLFIYSWLVYQYENNVETRFVLHDENAKEVEDFYTYHSSTVAGGTRVASCYQLINKIVREENLDADYNIYVFQGTDGDDWDSDGEKAIPELKIMLGYANRIGITVARDGYSSDKESPVEKYIKASGLLKQEKLIKMDSLAADSDQDRVIEGIRILVAP